MRIALLADLHLGFAFGNPKERERAEDSFLQAREAMEKAAKLADVIVIAGDLFDRRNPGTEVLHRAAEILNIPLHASSDVRVVGGSKKIDPRALTGVPIVAVHGNHDTRAGDRNNVVRVLESYGMLIYLHRDRVVFEKDGERVAITGIGWIPDDFAPAYFDMHMPEPEPDAYNIFVFHQPLKGLYPYPGERPVPIELLKRGYDVYVTGHLHWHTENVVDGRWIVIPGSTVRTQLRDREVEDPRMFYVLDTESGRLEEIEIESARRGYVYHIQLNAPDPEHVRRRVSEVVGDALRRNDRDRPPIVKIVLEGILEGRVHVSDLLDMFRGKAVVRIFDQTKSNMAEVLEEERERYLQSAEVFSREHVLSVIKDLLSKVGMSTGKDFDAFFALLEDGDVERAIQLAEQGNVFGEASGGKVKSGTLLDWVEG